jgi:hypothetical protein
MKRLFIISVIALAILSCNNNKTENTGTKKEIRSADLTTENPFLGKPLYTPGQRVLLQVALIRTHIAVTVQLLFVERLVQRKV